LLEIPMEVADILISGDTGYLLDCHNIVSQ